MARIAGRLPVRVLRMSDARPTDDDLSATTTPEQRLEMVWLLSRRMWELSGQPLPGYRRDELPVRVVRR